MRICVDKVAAQLIVFKNTHNLTNMSKKTSVEQAVKDYLYLTQLSQRATLALERAAAQFAAQFAEKAAARHLTARQFEQIMREQNQRLVTQLTDHQFALLNSMQR